MVPPTADLEALARDYARDGAVLVPGAFALGWLDLLAEGVEENFADPGPSSCHYTPEGEPGGFYDDYCNWQRIGAYRRFVFESGAADLVRRLMGAERVRFFHEHVLVKEPGTRETTPWHHDQPYYCVDGDQVATVWLPLDPVPLVAAPEFVAGSHRWAGYFRPRTFVDHAGYRGSESFAPVPDIDAERADHHILRWSLERGDAIVFAGKTLHAAPGTEGSTSRRRAFSTRWLGDDVIFAARPFTTSPPFADLDLDPGDPMDDPRFPVVD